MTAVVLVVVALVLAGGALLRAGSWDQANEASDVRGASPAPSSPASPSAAKPPSAQSSTATLSSTSPPSPAEPLPAPSSLAPRSSALAALATLRERGRAPRTGYDRALFGQTWADTDRNGCDTRNDILRRDLREIILRPGTAGCVVESGILLDPFSGSSIVFTRGEDTSREVQIDHVVALSDAWQKGAQQWTPERRVAFANDPVNLLAVDGDLNQRKGDGDAATWLPPSRLFRCSYIARQVGVKVKYGVWVTPAEQDAMRRVLSACPQEPVPTSDHPTESTVGAAMAGGSPGAPGEE